MKAIILIVFLLMLYWVQTFSCRWANGVKYRIRCMLLLFLQRDDSLLELIKERPELDTLSILGTNFTIKLHA